MVLCCRGTVSTAVMTNDITEETRGYLDDQHLLMTKSNPKTAQL